VPYYETVFIARQDISTPQAEALADQFTKVIEDMGGSVPRREYWGLRSLAYRIRKNRKGHYMLLNIEAPATAMVEVERQMGINEDIIRYLTIRADKLLSGPSAMMQARTARTDERGGRGDFRGGRGDRGRFGEGRGYEGRGEGRSFEGRGEGRSYEGRGEGRGYEGRRRDEAGEPARETAVAAGEGTGGEA
jgi:small subunit ribosomal protein S6